MNTENQGLTERQQQVLELLAQGYQSKNIAAELGLTEHTVKTHITNLFRKLGAVNRANAVLLAKEKGLLTPGPNGGCDFNCGKRGEPLIAFMNHDNGDQWICHLSCLKEKITIHAGKAKKTLIVDLPEGLYDRFIETVTIEGGPWRGRWKEEASVGAVESAVYAALLLFLQGITEETDLPDFREYASEKYPYLDEDLITMVADLIEREKSRLD